MYNRFVPKLSSRICTKLLTNPYKPFNTIRQNYSNFNQRLRLRAYHYSALPSSKGNNFSTYVLPYLAEPTSVRMSLAIDDISFKDNRIAVQDKSIKELIRSLVVYKLCSSQWLVNRAPSLLKLAEKAHLSALAYWIIRRTFFTQFCGGETAEQCINTMSQLNKHGIGSILDLSIESDINENGSLINNMADDVTGLMVNCIENAATQPNSFVAVKLTGLVNLSVLQNWSLALNFLSASFNKLDLDKDGKLERSEFIQFVRKSFGNDKENVAKTLFEYADENKTGLIDEFEFINVLSLDNLHARPLLVCNDDFYLGQQDFEDYDKMISRLEELCEIARVKNVRLMIDAEQLCFQPAIDNVAMKLSAKYNKPDHKNGPIVFNTYQIYLKDSTERLTRNYNLSSRENFVFAVKLVRGAYMFSERKRAEKLGYPDPIHNTLEDTHAAYDHAVEFLLNELSEFQKRSDRQLDILNSPIMMMIGTHNKESIIKACKRMKSLDISSKSGLVLFGQLLGMCDQISHTLGKYEYGVYKYVPFGKINEVIPYLIRRAQENSTVLGGGAGEEKQILWEEIMNRVFHPRLSLPSA